MLAVSLAHRRSPRGGGEERRFALVPCQPMTGAGENKLKKTRWGKLASVRAAASLGVLLSKCPHYFCLQLALQTCAPDLRGTSKCAMTWAAEKGASRAADKERAMRLRNSAQGHIPSPGT